MVERSGRRRFLARLIAGGAAMLPASWPVVGAARRVWAGPAAPPPLPGQPPDKGGVSAVTVKPDDPSITARSVEYPGLISPVQGYIAAPAGGEIYPGILLIHDADGLSPHAQDVARRLAKAGYVALLPDFLSRLGGTAKVGTTSQVVDAMSKLSIAQFFQDGHASIRYLETYPFVSKTRIGMLSFGLGGRFSWLLLTQNSDLKAGTIYYGDVPTLNVVPHIAAAVLAIYGDTDGHDPDDLKDLDAQMKKSGLPWTYKIEAKAGRGFFDDTRKSYDADAAKDAWKMTLDWYANHLTG